MIFSVNEREAILTASQADRSPGKLRVTPVTVANGQTVRIAGVGISDSGEPFANSSSLCLTWELSNCGDLAYWDDAYGSRRSKSSWERFLILRNESGSVLSELSCIHLYATLHMLFNVLSICSFKLLVYIMIRK